MSHHFLLVATIFGPPNMDIIRLGLAKESRINITCIDTEREALLTFTKGLTDPSGRLSSWVGIDYCQWSGIRCNNISGNVINLDFDPFPSSTYGIASLAEDNIQLTEARV